MTIWRESRSLFLDLGSSTMSLTLALAPSLDDVGELRSSISLPGWGTPGIPGVLAACLVHSTHTIASFGKVIEHPVFVSELNNVEGRYLDNTSRLMILNIDHFSGAYELLIAFQRVQRVYRGQFTTNLWLHRQITDVIALQTTCSSFAALDHLRSS